jgi:hypothetical protein
MKTLLALWMARLLKLLHGVGPYAAIELLLPGGSLIALLIWLYRFRRVATAESAKNPRHTCVPNCAWLARRCNL